MDETSNRGLHYNRFRYYDPETAQYISPEPIGLAGGDRPYGYVHNSISWVDPLGLANYTPKDAQKKVLRGQGPQEVTRIDKPDQSILGSQWHVHGKNGGAINHDGSIHDANPSFSNKTLRWLQEHGWDI